MEEDKLSVSKTHEQNQQYSQFSDSSGDFESLLKDIANFVLFLRLICKNKYVIKTLPDKRCMNNNTTKFNNGSSGGVGESKCNDGDSVTKKFDNTNLQQLARKLLDKFESMKVWEIYNQIHLETNNNIRDDIIYFMNLLESKFKTDTKFKFKFQRKNKETNTDRSCFYKKFKRDSPTETPSKAVGTNEVKEEKCISNMDKNMQQSFLYKSKVLDLKMFKSFKSKYVNENLPSKVPLGTEADCYNTLKIIEQNHNQNVKDDKSVIREKETFSSKMTVTSGRNITCEACCSTIGTNKLHNFFQRSTALDLSVLENDKNKIVAENTNKTLEEDLSVNKFWSNCVDDQLSNNCRQKNKAHKNVSKRDFTQNYCHNCMLQSSSTESDTQNCSGRTQQKSSTEYKNIISEMTDKQNPSTITVQNVTDMLFSLCMTLNSAPSYIKDQRIMELNPPTSMKEAVYVLAHVTKFINDSKQNDAANCDKGKDGTKVVNKKSYELFENLMTLLASSPQEENKFNFV